MADLQREGLVSTGDMPMFAGNMAGLGAVTGLGAANVTNFVRQGAEMFRGSTLGMGGGMNLMAAAVQDTRDMMRGSDVGSALVRELGGVDAATIGRVEANVNFMNSTLGALSYNNWRAGGGLGDRRDILHNASGLNYFEALELGVQMDEDIASGALDQSEVARQRIAMGGFERYVTKFNRKMNSKGVEFWDSPDHLQGYFRHMVNTGQAKSVAAASDLFMQAFDHRQSSAVQKSARLRGQIGAMSQPQDVGA